MPGGIWTRAQTLIFGAAVGRASSETLTGVLEPVRQRSWLRNRVRVLDLGRVGELAAKGLIPADALAEEAARNGYEPSRLAAVTALAQSYPGLADLDKMSNRELVNGALIDKALSRHAIPGEYHAAIKALFQDLLSPAEVAGAVQQGHLPNPGVLPDVGTGTTPPGGWTQPVAPDSQPPSEVPLTTIDIDPFKEAGGGGIDEDRLRVLANLAGLPPGAHDLLTMWNRDFITEEAVDAGIREGHLKTKWTAAFKRLRWGVLSPQEAAAARLRQWMTKEEADEVGKLHGLTSEQMELMFLNRGRPASPTQMWTAWARKVIGPRGVPTEFADHAKAIAISDIRPEYAEMLWGIRFAYPALFMINRLVSAKAIDVDTAVKWAEFDRYGEDVTGPLRKYWTQLAAGKGAGASAAAKEATASDLVTLAAGQAPAVTDVIAALEALGYPADEAQRKVALTDARRVLAAQNAAISDLHGVYKKGGLDDPTALAALTTIGVADWAAPNIVQAWRAFLTATAPPPAA